MASDHRGRELHAGKRTAQELGWSTNEVTDWTRSTADPFPGDVFLASTAEMGEATPGKNAPVMSRSFVDSTKEGSSRWSVLYSENHPNIETVKDAPSNLGKRKRKTSLVDSPPYSRKSRGSPMLEGLAKTPARAMIAAEAMKKRVAEGRDLKTGRPKK